MRKILKIIVFIAVLLVIAATLLPWQRWVEHKLIAVLESKGLTPAVLTVDSIGLSGVVVKDVALGEPPLKLSRLTVGYAPRALLRGEIEEVKLYGLALNASRGENGWGIDGTSGLIPPPAADAPATPPAIPVTRAALAVLPVSSIGVSESSIHAAISGWELEIPLQLTLTISGTPKLTFESSAISAHKGADSLTTGKLTIDLTLDEAKKQWQGKWAIADITFTSEALMLPKLQAAGDLTLTADTIIFSGAANDANKTTNAQFLVDYSLSKPDSSLAVISSVNMPWGGGSIGANKVQLPLGGKKATTLTLNVKKVAIATLLKALSDDSTTATGVVSGTLPITLRTDGQIRIGKGSLKAEEPGVISLSPQAIPGDNQQVGLVRDVLKNLHYSLLSLETDMAPDNTLSVTLAVEGNNPDIEKGRPIKLKVHLSGDLLNLIKQNLKLMTDPTNFIKQENHEKN